MIFSHFLPFKLNVSFPLFFQIPEFFNCVRVVGFKNYLVNQIYNLKILTYLKPHLVKYTHILQDLYNQLY